MYGKLPSKIAAGVFYLYAVKKHSKSNEGNIKQLCV